MTNASHHYSLDFEPNYVFVNGEAILRKHWSFADGQLEITYGYGEGADVWAAIWSRSGSGVSKLLSGEMPDRDWPVFEEMRLGDEREAKAREEVCKAKITRAADHMVDKAGFTLDQTMAISAMFTAMIESHEATWGKR